VFNDVDVVLGFDDLTQYCANDEHPYFGALIGRVANRIANGSFELNNNIYHTPVNEPAPSGGNDTLHGGYVGFDRRVWEVAQASSSTATLKYESFDGEEGFPGDLLVTVTYSLDDNNTWWIDYTATGGDKDTVIGLTQHTYWNLNGGQEDITEHVLHLPKAERYLSVDDHLIPDGCFVDVASTPWMDFTVAKPIGVDITCGTVADGGGYDNAFIYNDWTDGEEPRVIASVMSPLTSISMEVISDQPSIQFYSGNGLDGTLPQKSDQNDGAYYVHWGALALEAQHFPDSVHHQDDPSWPNVVLKAGATYHQLTGYRFSTAE